MCQIIRFVFDMFGRKAKSKPCYLKRSEGYSEKYLFQFASMHFEAGAALMKTAGPNCIFSAGYLLHLCLELILKACSLYENDYFLKDHKLLKIIKSITIIKFDKESIDKLRLLTKYEALRYGMEGLDSVGQGDEDIFIAVIGEISKQMPSGLYDFYREAFKKFLNS